MGIHKTVVCDICGDGIGEKPPGGIRHSRLSFVTGSYTDAAGGTSKKTITFDICGKCAREALKNILKDKRASDRKEIIHGFVDSDLREMK